MKKISVLALAAFMSVASISASYAQSLPADVLAEVQAAAATGDAEAVAALILQFPQLARAITAAAVRAAPTPAIAAQVRAQASLAAQQAGLSPQEVAAIANETGTGDIGGDNPASAG